VPVSGPGAVILEAEVLSSTRPGLRHVVRWLASGAWTCSCEGYEHHERCRHIDKVRARADYEDIRLAGGLL
jgi:hypothetical protein